MISTSTSRSLQTIQYLNFLIVPGLFIWIWAKSGFQNAGLFVVAYFAISRIFDFAMSLIGPLFGLVGMGVKSVAKRQPLENILKENMQTDKAGFIDTPTFIALMISATGELIIPWVLLQRFA